MSVANVRYGFQAQAWDDPLSFGVQAFIEYNGYVINDRYQSDRIRVTNITGLGDPDVYDARDANAGAHGEVAYDSWYRGRTILLTGQIQGGSLGTMTRMERDFKAAYAPLVESPLKFRWFDSEDGFDDPQTLDNYDIYGPVPTVGQGLLLMPLGTSTLVRASDRRLFGDVQQTIRFLGAQDTSSVSLVLKFKDQYNYVRCSFNASSGHPTLTITVFVDATPYQLASLAIPNVYGVFGAAGTGSSSFGGYGVFGGTPYSSGIAQGRSVWLRAKIEGNLVTAELWDVPPTDGVVPNLVTSAWLTGSDADTYGDTVLAQAGFQAHTTDPTTTWALDDYQIESLYPGDVTFNAKKLSPLTITDSQDSMTRFTRAFQLTMRTSEFRALGATLARSQTLVPTSHNPNILSINNRGSTFTDPLIIFYGAAVGLSIQNLVNGQAFIWSGILADGDLLYIDCHTKMILNGSGENMLEFYDPQSSWIQLKAGWNDLSVPYISGFSSNTKMVVFYRGAWM